MTVIVGQLSLNEEAPIEDNKMLYIEYRFLGVPLEETETPYSLPRPDPYNEISFNFTKGRSCTVTTLLALVLYLYQ